MSLLKQLLISVSLAIAVILAGTLWVGLDSTRDYLNSRLQVDAENAASALALSLSQTARHDPDTRELLITALFDSGHYRSISFTDPDGEVLLLLEGKSEAGQAAVPGWFDAWLPLQTPTATRAVTDGSRQTGQIMVTADDVPARETLWRMAYRVLFLVVGAGLLWAIFAVFLMRWLGQALRDAVANEVRSIAESSEAPASPTGGAQVKELAPVQNVIAAVRERVRATADEQNRQIEFLELELNADEVTGLANRRYFINELRRTLRPIDETASAAGVSHYGHVLIFRQRDLTSINAHHERRETDDWLRRVADSVQAVVASSRDMDRPAPLIARLNGSDFVVLLAGYDGPDTTDLIQTLRQTLDALRIPTSDERLCRWSYALTDYGPACDVSAVLARLDHGLMRAENAGHDEVEYMASSEYRSIGPAGSGGETAWKILIQEGLREGRLTLNVFESNYRDDDTADRHEALLALREAKSDNTISGYLFMPPAVRLGLSGACDLRALELGLAWVRENPGTLSLRVSLASLLLPDFLPEMARILLAAELPETSLKRLVLEIDAHGFVAYPEELDNFCELAAKLGVGVGVRRLAEQPAALLRLHKVNIRYIKLGGDLISGLMDSPGATQLIAAITEAAIGQGVKIYAHDVPNAATAALLREYGVLMPIGDTFLQEEEELEGGFVDQ